ncbi:hypothetical protein [Amphibacillus cookii]|uniref:hypothetical protein n=1 Tax=Amphibacillus cookii TaxID=767787 RepID=UPI00195AE20F|nr:hypothetical protein [Amphibacillus cookii]MBM7540981.1 hypothetical protein [Amphibacillus cookii]
MFKAVQVYVHDEDEAEALRSKLSKFDTKEVMIDYIEQEQDIDLVIPYAQTGTTGADSPNIAGGMGQVVAYQEIADDDKRDRNAVLSFQVTEADFNDALEAIQLAGGYVDRGIFK